MSKKQKTNWEQTLQLKHYLEQETKARSMIYQVSFKEEAARAFGKPLDYYYNYSYKNWSRISKLLVKKREKVMDECIKLGIPYDMPFDQFPHYRKRMGLEN